MKSRRELVPVFAFLFLALFSLRSAFSPLSSDLLSSLEKPTTKNTNEPLPQLRQALRIRPVVRGLLERKLQPLKLLPLALQRGLALGARRGGGLGGRRRLPEPEELRDEVCLGDGRGRAGRRSESGGEGGRRRRALPLAEPHLGDEEAALPIETEFCIVPADSKTLTR